MWTLSQAQRLVSELHDVVWDVDYHICVGGSVLYQGSAEKDLDLFFLPLNGFERRPEDIYNVLDGVFGPLRSLRDSPDYAAGNPWHIQNSYKGSYCGKRVDLFIW